jgi:hypothetical protein
MMGRQGNIQRQLFYHKVNLDKRIRNDHILRKVEALIDFNFIYNEVADKYGAKGNVSIVSLQIKWDSSVVYDRGED